MKLLPLIAGIASVAVALPSSDMFDLEERMDGCPQVQVVALGGEGTTLGDLGYLDTTISNITSRVPHSKSFQIGYPAGADSATAIADGVPALQSHIPKFSQRCPDSKMILVGYSAGAAVVGNVLCGDANTGDDPLATHFRHHIIGVILYGDPTFLLGKSYDRGTCTYSDGTVPRQFPGKCFPYGGKMRSYCDENDPDCCGGTDTEVHFEYPGLYDTQVAAFALAKYAYWRNHMSSSSSGSSGGSGGGGASGSGGSGSSSGGSGSSSGGSGSSSGGSGSSSGGSGSSSGSGAPSKALPAPAVITPFFNIEPPSL